MNKNDQFELIITDMGNDGEGIGKYDGFTWFVKDAVMGDKIIAQAMKLKKNYGFARLVKVIEPSDKRVETKCPVARPCGGCQLQMMAYGEQLKYKENKVKNNLQRIGGFGEDVLALMEPIMGMEEPFRYRNKAQFPIGTDKEGRIIAGFYAGRTHSIIECEDCLLGVKENKDILQIVIDTMNEFHIRPYDEETHKGLVRHVLIRKGFTSGQVMVCIVINGDKLPEADTFAARLMKIPGMTSISVNINTEKTNVILGDKLINLVGPGYIEDSIGGIRYRISPLSFYQVNPVQTEKLYGTALEYAGLDGGETVWDLYCGIGTISLFLAQKAGKVYGVEIIPQAIDNAKENAELNGFTNTEFFVGKAEEVLPEQYKKNNVHAEVIVVDPPRKGCDEKCIETMLLMEPEKIVYVSCDSATLARDLKILCEEKYKIERIRCCDMFPHSTHVETVVLMSKVNTLAYDRGFI